MFILRDLLTALQAPFSATDPGRERAQWFVFTRLAVIVPFTSSMTSNLLRSLRTLFGLDLNRRHFYTFMASSTFLDGAVGVEPRPNSGRADPGGAG